jgi:hypothetical protein
MKYKIVIKLLLNKKHNKIFDLIKKPVLLKKDKMYNIIYFCWSEKIFLVTKGMLEKFKREISWTSL